MARIQILELPMVHHGEDTETPFAVIIDQADDSTLEALGMSTNSLSPMGGLMQTLSISVAEQLGARTVLVFEETVDIPANELTFTHVQEAADGNIVRLRVEPDLDGFTDKVMAEVAKAQADARAAFK